MVLGLGEKSGEIGKFGGKRFGRKWGISVMMGLSQVKIALGVWG